MKIHKITRFKKTSNLNGCWLKISNYIKGITGFAVVMLFLLTNTSVNAQSFAPCIDGNSVEWDAIQVTGNSTYELRHDTFSGNMDSIFTSSKDFKSWGNWTPTPDYSTWTTSPMQAKSDIMNASAVIFTGIEGTPAGCTSTFGAYDPFHTYLFFAGDRESNNGTGYIGFWFNLNGSVAIDDGNKYFFPDHYTNFGEPDGLGGTFDAVTSIGDILVLADFDNGGTVATVTVLKWVGPGNGNLGNNNSLFEIGIASQVGQNNANLVAVPSNFIVPAGQMTADITDGINGPEDNIDNPVKVYDYNEFYEGVVDLTPIFNLANNPKLLCTATWMLETRSSSSITADSKDFVGGNFNLTPTVVASDDTVCEGEPASLTATLSEGDPLDYTFTWSPDNGNFSGQGTDTITFASAVIGDAGVYTVTVTSETQCEPGDPATGTLAVNTVSCSIVGTDLLCNGDSSGSLVATGADGTAPYMYSIDGGATWQASGTFTGLSAGPYTVDVKDANDCQSTCVVTLSEPPLLVASCIAVDALCFGDEGSITVSATGGTPPYTGTGTFNSVAGTYTYTVTDANDCVATATCTINEPPLLEASCIAVDALCFGDEGSITVSATGGTPPYTGTGTFNSVAGTYTYTVTDANDCVATATCTINEPPLLEASCIAVDALCFGYEGSITVSATGGTPPYTGTGTFNSVAGTYTYTVTDANDCVATATCTIAEPPLLVASCIAVDALCNGADGSITVSATGGTPPYTGTGTFNNGAGTYTYTVSDANGCESTTTCTIIEASTLVVSCIAVDALCYGEEGSITVSATGGTPPYTGTGTFNSVAGTYTYTVTDANDCEASTTCTINEPPLLVASCIAVDALCYGYEGSITVSATGGTPPYTGTGTFNSVAGTYTYTVTDANDCVATTTCTIAEPPLLVASCIAVDALCYGDEGSITVSATGGTPPYTGTGTFNSVAGTYTYTVTDANDCVATTTCTIAEPPLLVASCIAVDALCYGDEGSITVSATGGTPPYTGTGTFNNVAGTYTYTVTDANDCVATTTCTIAEPPLLVASCIAVDALCYGDEGSITVSATGGTPPYTGTGTFNNVAGTYTYTVTDANDCVATTTCTIAEPPLLVASCIAVDALCYGDEGSITVSATGGTPPYTGTGTFNSVAGTYTYTVTDANDCVATTTCTIAEPPLLSCVATTGDLICEGLPIELFVVGSGGTPPFTYSWSSDGAATYDDATSATPIANGAVVGEIFTATVTDANGCVTTCEIMANLQVCIVDCGTAFGVFINAEGEVNDDASRCFRLDGFGRWGWTNLIEDFGTHTLEMYQGAGKCDLNKGTYVGTVTITYTQIGTTDEGEVYVSYNMAPGYGLAEAHLYIGCEKYPTKPNGAPTVAPGQFTFKEGDLEHASVWDTDDAVITATGGFYIIAHAVACGEDVPKGSFIPTSPMEHGSFTGEEDADCEVTVDESTKTVNFTAYPVPFENEINIKYFFEYDTDVTIDIYDLKGILVAQVVNGNYVSGTQGKAKIDLSKLDNQMYFVSLTTSGGTVVKKIISASDLKR